MDSVDVEDFPRVVRAAVLVVEVPVGDSAAVRAVRAAVPVAVGLKGSAEANTAIASRSRYDSTISSTWSTSPTTAACSHRLSGKAV